MPSWHDRALRATPRAHAPSRTPARPQSRRRSVRRSNRGNPQTPRPAAGADSRPPPGSRSCPTGRLPSGAARIRSESDRATVPRGSRRPSTVPRCCPEALRGATPIPATPDSRPGTAPVCGLSRPGRALPVASRADNAPAPRSRGGSTDRPNRARSSARPGRSAAAAGARR